MIIFILLCTIGFYINLSMGLHVLKLNPRHKTHIIYFLLQVLFAFSSLGCIIFQLFKSETSIFFLYKHGVSVSVFIPALAVILSLQLSKVIRLKKIHYIIILIPIIGMIVKNVFTSSLVNFIRYNNSWRIMSIENQIYFYLYFILYNIYLIFFIIINSIWFFKTNYKREKKQALILLFSFFIAIFTYSIYMVLGFHVLKIIKYEFIGSGSLFMTIWTVGFWYCLVRYRLLSITPEIVSKDILANIDESIILLDNEGIIITVNDKTKALTSNNKLEGESLLKVIFEFQEVNKEIIEMMERKTKDFSCRLHYLSNDNEKILMDTKFSLVKDNFKDNIGIMIIGKEVKEIKQLKTYFKITDREAEIIPYIIYGYTNKKVAEKIGTTEATVKAHVTHIFNKTGVDNKIQLINFLKDFNLLPEKNAEKFVIL